MHLAFAVLYLTYLVEANIKDRLGGVAGKPNKNVSLYEGGSLVRGWRIKFIFLLIVYFAGFATAVYTLAPAPDDEARTSQKSNRTNSAQIKFDSNEFVKSLNSGMHKCVDFSKKVACRTAEFIKEKIEERQLHKDS